MADPQKLDPVVPKVSPSFRLTPGLANLINDDVLTAKVARAAPEFDKVLAQAQLDLTTEDNKDNIGAVCLALRVVRDIFATFQARGEAVIELENTKK